MGTALLYFKSMVEYTDLTKIKMKGKHLLTGVLLLAVVAGAGAYAYIDSSRLKGSFGAAPSAFTSNTLQVSLASSPVSSIEVKSSQDVYFTGITAYCASTLDCTINDLTVQGYFDDDADGLYETSSTSTVDAADHGTNLTDIVDSLRILDASGTEVGAAEVTNLNSFQVTFSSLGWTLTSEDTEIFYLVGDLSNSAYGDSDAENIAFGIAAESDVAAEDSDGAVLAISGTVNTTPSVYVTTKENGSLTIAVSSNTRSEDIVLAYSEELISVFEFTTTDEAFLITDLAVNNRQSNVLASTLGDYDNNVTSVIIEYEDIDGVVQRRPGALSLGTAAFNGLRFYIPEDDSATLTVYAEIPAISTSTAGEFIDLSLAFNDFEAVGQTSGYMFGAEAIDASVRADADLDFGTISYTSGLTHFYLDGAQVGETILGASHTLTIDDGVGDNTNKLPAGTIVCIDEDLSGTCATEDVYIVTDWPFSTAGTEDLVALDLLDDAGDSSYVDGAPFLYALPGTGFFTSTNLMQVYESKPTLALASSSPSGTRSVSVSEDAFIFNVTADALGKIQVNPSVDYATCVAGTGTRLTSATNASISVDGSSCELTSVNTAGDSVLYAASSLSSYSYASFWFRWNDKSANSTDLVPGDLQVVTADANDGVEDKSSTVTATQIIGSPKLLVENTWYLIRDVPMPLLTNTADAFIGLAFQDTNALAREDIVYIDQFKVYNQKIEIDMTSSADFDRTYNQGSSSAVTPVLVSLNDGETTVATGYVDTVALDADRNGSEDSTDGSAATVLLVPTSTHGTLEIAAGNTKTYTVNLSMSNLLAEDSGVDDPVTFSIGYGSSTDGTVRPGDFYWYETNATVKWLGYLSSTSLISNTVIY